MSWEWSHTAEAYENVRRNIADLPKRKLLEVLREWAYADRERKGRKPSFRQPVGQRKLPQDILADLVWDRASEHATCSNGGWDAYICPDGCHTVSFDRDSENSE